MENIIAKIIAGLIEKSLDNTSDIFYGEIDCVSISKCGLFKIKLNSGDTFNVSIDKVNE